MYVFLVHNICTCEGNTDEPHFSKLLSGTAFTSLEVEVDVNFPRIFVPQGYRTLPSTLKSPLALMVAHKRALAAWR